MPPRVPRGHRPAAHKREPRAWARPNLGGDNRRADASTQPKAHPQPRCARPAITHTRRCAAVETAACAAPCGSPSAPSHPAPAAPWLPLLTKLCATACAGLCGAHTQWVAPRSWPGGRGGFHGRNGTRAARVLRLATPTPCPHTQPRSCTWPTLRRTPTLPERHARRRATGPIRASRCVCLLCTPPCSRQCTRPASSHGEAAPPTARHSHCTAACSSLPTARKQVAKKPRSPVPVGVPLCPLARPFCRTALGSRGVHPQRAAPCTAHRSHKTS